MAVASKSPASAHKRQASSKAKAVNKLDPSISSLRAQGLHNHPRPKAQVPILPSARPAPMWLRRLCSLQRSSLIVTFLLTSGMLAVYGWTVYSQQEWTQAYRKLEALQRSERQLITASEVLKNQMAQQAEQPETALVPSVPAWAIFLPPDQNNQSTVAVPTPAIKTKITPMPLGY